MKGIVRGNVTISDNVREAIEKRMANIVRERIEGYMERDYVMLLAREVHETFCPVVLADS